MWTLASHHDTIADSNTLYFMFSSDCVQIFRQVAELLESLSWRSGVSKANLNTEP